MREIKFRAWNKKKCEMRYDLRVENTRLPELGTKNKGLPLMQYTGLKDKNGKEIYEGDIVMWTEDYCCYKKGIRQKVEWDNEECGFSPFCITNNIEENEWLNINFIKVIGNIYDNPELLDNKK